MTSWEYTDVGFTGTARWEVTREKYRWTPSKKGINEIYNSNVYRNVEADMIRLDRTGNRCFRMEKAGSFTFFAGYSMDWRYERKSTQGNNVEKTPPTETGSGFSHHPQHLFHPEPEHPGA